MIVGVDVSSRAIHLGWLENGCPRRWHQEMEGKHLIDRLRKIRVQWPEDTVEVAVEYPFGRGNAIAALMSTVGVITRQAPPWARVAWPSAGELRAAIGAKNTKDSAHGELCGVIAVEHGWLVDSWDEHELDSLVAAVGWARILEQQDAA